MAVSIGKIQVIKEQEARHFPLCCRETAMDFADRTTGFYYSYIVPMYNYEAH